MTKPGKFARGARAAIVVAGVAAVFGCINPASALPVPLTECLGCQMPTGQLPPGCFYRELWCDRTDSAPYQISAGTLTLVIGETLLCDNCLGCPDCPPPPMLCNGSLTVSTTESITHTINSGIEVGIDDIKASLSSSIGVTTTTTVSATFNCGAGGDGAPPCKLLEYAATMSKKTGVKYAVDHMWTRWGEIDAHFGETCSMEGIIWQTPDCFSCTSTATGSKVVSSACTLIRNEDCASSPSK